MSKHYSRRDLLSRVPGLLWSVPLWGRAANAQEHSFHAKAEESAAAMPGMSIEDDPVLAVACRKRVVELRGLTPMQFLTSFDYGKVVDEADKKIREFQLTAVERTVEVAPGITMDAWTYNGSVPGPTLRCTEGDHVRVRFTNQGKSEHTIHFHGIHSSKMDGVEELVQPGQTAVYEFVAAPAALQLYHCHSVPVALHMNRGLYGAFIIDPPIPRPQAKEMVVILNAWDLNFDRRNELYAMNGAVNFYRDNPIPVRLGESVRMYVLNLMEYEPVCSLHLHANFFKLFRTGSEGQQPEKTDVVTLSQAERCILEFSYHLPGLYMFHPHQNLFAERGCTGHFLVA